MERLIFSKENKCQMTERAEFGLLPDAEQRLTYLRWLKMAYETEKACLLIPQESPCVFQTAEEKDDIPGMGEDSVLEMLSCSKFMDLESWLCMPSTLLPRSLDSTGSLPLSNGIESGNTETRSLERKSIYFKHSPERENCLMPLSPISPVSVIPHSPVELQTSSTPTVKPNAPPSCQSSVTVRKRRRLAASPGGLHWNSTGSVLREYDRGNSAGALQVKRVPEPVRTVRPNTEPWRDRTALRKCMSVDDRLLQQTPTHSRTLLSRLERGKKKLKNIHNTELKWCSNRTIGFEAASGPKQFAVIERTIDSRYSTAV